MRFCLALILTVTPALAFAQMDAGTSTLADGGGMPDSGGAPDAGGCGPITVQGECQGNIVYYCDDLNDELIVVDCPNDFDPNSVCQEISPEFGVFCALITGEECIYEENGFFYSDFCAGTEAGCVETPQQSMCEANVGTCTLDDELTCRGQRLIYECNESQPWLVDCAAFLGTCEEGHCLVPSGILCDDDTLVCEPGTVCGLAGLCETVTEQDAGVPDSGSAGADAGSKGDDDEGCSCATSQNDRRMPYLLLFVAAWFIVRRRGRR